MVSFSVLRLLVVGCVSLLVKGDALDDSLQALLQKHQLKGMAVVMFRGDTYSEPITRVAGVKDCAGGAVDLDTAFMLASTSKPVTGLATAIAIEQGLIPSIDTPINNLLPYSVTNPSHRTSAITPRQLLTHRSSVVNGAPAGFGNAEPSYAPPPKGTNPTCPLDKLTTWYNDVFVNRASQSGYGGTAVPNWYQLAFQGDNEGLYYECCAPGECNEYSNLGTGLMGAVVEERAGKGFQDYCDEHIFTKAGMTSNTAWFSRDLPQSSNEAHPFNYKGPNNFECGEPYCFTDYPSGSLRTSARDLAIYLRMMADEGVAPNGQRIISQASFDQMTHCIEQDDKGSPVSDAECKNGFYWYLLDKSEFGFLEPKFGSWADIRANGFWHDGAEYGAQSEMLVITKPIKMAVGFVTNTGSELDASPYDSFQVLKELIALMPDTPPQTPTGAPSDAPTDAPTGAPTTLTTSTPTCSSTTVQALANIGGVEIRSSSLTSPSVFLSVPNACVFNNLLFSPQPVSGKAGFVVAVNNDDNGPKVDLNVEFNKLSFATAATGTAAVAYVRLVPKLSCQVKSCHVNRWYTPEQVPADSNNPVITSHICLDGQLPGDPNGSCYCDDACTRWKDCCDDYLAVCVRR